MSDTPGNARLSAQDASFLGQARAGAPLNVAGLIRLAQTPDGLSVARLRELVELRLSGLWRLRQRLTFDSGGPVWVDDPSFAIEHHVDALDLTAGDPALVATIARLHATPLDTDRPLWTMSLASEDARWGAAILFRASHALVDGMGAMLIMRSVFDSSRSQRGTPIATPADESTAGDTIDQADAFEVARDIWETLRPHVRRELTASEYERALALLDGWMSMLARGGCGGPYFASTQPVRTRVSLTELDHAGLRSVRRRHDQRFDVVGLTVVAAAIGRLLEARGESTTDVRVRTLVPVALRGARRAALGNRAAFLLVTVPVAPMDPMARLASVAEEVGEALASGQHRASAMSMRALETVPPESSAAMSAFTAGGHFVDLVVSCVPGSRQALALDGIPHAVTYPILPITDQMRVAVGFADIGGSLGAAVCADEHVLPELDFFTDALVRASKALVAAAS